MRRLRALDATAIPRAFLLAGIVAVPVLFDRAAEKPFDAVKLSALWVLGGAAFAAWAIQALRGRVGPVRFALMRPAGVFLGAVALATLFSETKITSVFGVYGRFNGLLTFVLVLAVSWLLVQLYWHRPERIGEVLVAFGVASSIAVVYILAQWQGLDPFHWAELGGGEIAHPAGPLGNSNFAGGFLGITSPWLLFAFLRARGWTTRVLVVAWSAPTMWALWVTGSRGGVIAVIGAALGAAIAFRGRWPRWLTIVAVAASSLVLAAALVLTIKPSLTPGGRHSTGVLRSGTAVSRGFWWRGAVRIVKAHPIVGTGPDSFGVVFPRVAGADSPGATSDVETPDEPHNVYLGHAASKGIVGLVAYLAVVVLALRWAFRRTRRAVGATGDALVASIALLCGYLAQAFFSIDMIPLLMSGWIAIGCVAVLSDPVLVARREASGVTSAGAPGSRHPAVRTAALALAIVLALLGAALGVRLWLADRTVKITASDPMLDRGELQQKFDRAISLAPWEPIYRGLAGDFLEKSALSLQQADVKQAVLTQSVLYFKSMDRVQPGNALWKMSVGEALGMLGQAGDQSAFAEADLWFEAANRLAPYDWRVRIRYGEMLNRWGRAADDYRYHCRALSQLQTAVGYHPTDPRALIGLGETYGFLGRFDEGLVALDRAITASPSSLAESERRQLLALQHEGIKPLSCS